MEPGQTSQVAIAGLIFALLSFAAAVTAGVYVLFYQTSDKHAAKKALSMVASRPEMMYPRAPAAAQVQQQSLSASYNQMPPQPMMAVPPMQTLSGAYTAPSVPKTVSSGPVGTFFDDELPQA